MMWGSDRLQAGHFAGLRKRLRGGALALLTHDSAVDRQGARLVEVLESLGARPSLVFSPEHGLDGVAQAEEAVPSIEAGALPRVVSLYGTTRESLTPEPSHFDGIDTLVVDLVDIGSRYYTYVWTALLAARAAAERGVHTLVLDRPNPIGGAPEQVEGRPQQPGFLSFVGLEPIAVRHGLTLGEILCWAFERDGLPLGGDGALSVMGCEAWERRRTALGWNRPFVPPSPNMPSVETALIYPGGCLVEGTNLSEGRGTAFPFRVVGAPFLDGERLARELGELGLDGVLFRPVAFRPSFEKHEGAVCRGVMLHTTDANALRPVRTVLALLTLARRQAPDQFRFLDRVYEFESEVPAFDLLCGNAQVRSAMLADASVHEVCDLLCPVDAEQRELVPYAEALCLAAQPG